MPDVLSCLCQAGRPQPGTQGHSQGTTLQGLGAGLASLLSLFPVCPASFGPVSGCSQSPGSRSPFPPPLSWTGVGACVCMWRPGNGTDFPLPTTIPHPPPRAARRAGWWPSAGRLGALAFSQQVQPEASLTAGFQDEHRSGPAPGAPARRGQWAQALVGRAVLTPYTESGLCLEGPGGRRVGQDSWPQVWSGPLGLRALDERGLGGGRVW